MPTTPATFNIAQSIKALATTALFSPPLADGSTSYKTVNIGALRDYTELVPLLEIEGRDDRTRRAAVGGKIQDSIIFLLRSIVPYSSAASTAEQDIFTIRDALTPIFHTHARLGEAGLLTGILDSRIDEKAGRFLFALRNGVWWRAHEMQLIVTYEYTVEILP